MARSHSGEELLGFTPFLKGSDALSDKIGKARFPSYQAALFAHDCIAVILAFGFGVWISGLGSFLLENSIQYVSLFIWCFSNLVEESLVNFQLKISQVMKAVGFTFNDFDFVINPLQFTGMDGIFTMVQDAIAMAFKHFYEAV